MSQRYSGNKKRPKLEEIQPGILKIYVFCQKIQQSSSAPGVHCWCYVFIYENMPWRLSHLLLKSCHKFTLWFKEGCSWGIVVTKLRSKSRLHANTDIYWRKQLNRQAHLELCHRNPDILEKVLHQITLSNSTAGKSTLRQVIKQPQHGRTSPTKE